MDQMGLLEERFLSEGLLFEGLMVPERLLPEGLLCQVHDLLWGTRALDGPGGEGEHGIPSLNNHLVFSVADPGPGVFLPLDPGSGMEKKSGSRSGIWDEHPRSYFQELKNSFLG
jgi:hypothetical protein